MGGEGGEQEQGAGGRGGRGERVEGEGWLHSYQHALNRRS